MSESIHYTKLSKILNDLDKDSRSFQLYQYNISEIPITTYKRAIHFCNELIDCYLNIKVEGFRNLLKEIIQYLFLCIITFKNLLISSENGDEVSLCSKICKLSDQIYNQNSSNVLKLCCYFKQTTNPRSTEEKLYVNSSYSRPKNHVNETEDVDEKNKENIQKFNPYKSGLVAAEELSLEQLGFKNSNGLFHLDTWRFEQILEENREVTNLSKTNAENKGESQEADVSEKIKTEFLEESRLLDWIAKSWVEGNLPNSFNEILSSSKNESNITKNLDPKDKLPKKQKPPKSGKTLKSSESKETELLNKLNNQFHDQITKLMFKLTESHSQESSSLNNSSSKFLPYKSISVIYNMEKNEKEEFLQSLKLLNVKNKFLKNKKPKKSRKERKTLIMNKKIEENYKKAFDFNEFESLKAITDSRDSNYLHNIQDAQMFSNRFYLPSENQKYFQESNPKLDQRESLQSIIEKIAIPLYLNANKYKNSTFAKFLLFYGPQGTGKRFTSEITSSLTNSRYFDATYLIDLAFAGKLSDSLELLKKLFLTVCHSNTSIIFFEGFERLLKKQLKLYSQEIKTAVKGFRLELLKMYKIVQQKSTKDKNFSLAVICSISVPLNNKSFDCKLLIKLSDFLACFTLPSYETRIRFIQNKIYSNKQTPSEKDQVLLHKLAQILEGYTIGSINEVLSNRDLRFPTDQYDRELFIKEFIQTLIEKEYYWIERNSEFKQFVIAFNKKSIKKHTRTKNSLKK